MFHSSDLKRGKHRRLVEHFLGPQLRPAASSQPWAWRPHGWPRPVPLIQGAQAFNRWRAGVSIGNCGMCHSNSAFPMNNGYDQGTY